MIAEALLDDLRTELLALMTTAVDGLVARARTKLELVEKEAEELKAKGLAEVAAQREALGREVAVMQRHQEQSEGRVELDVGGVRYRRRGLCGPGGREDGGCRAAAQAEARVWLLLRRSGHGETSG